MLRNVMKEIWVLLLFFVIPLAELHAIEKKNYFDLFLETDNRYELDEPKIKENWNSFKRELEKHPFSSNGNETFVRFIFQKVHRKYLKHYDRKSNFGDLFLPEATFNCVTATGVFALIFEEFNIEFTLMETNHHVYILLPELNMLVESTNKENGLIKGKNNIEKRISKYVEENKEDQNILPLFINKSIKLEQYVGLLLYNKAIDYVKTSQWNEAKCILEKAEIYYYSLRIFHLKKIVNAQLPENQTIYVSYKK